MYNAENLDAFLSPFDTDRQQSLMEAYLQSLSAKRSQCQHAIENQNMKDLYAALHDIKSLGLTIGATDLGIKAREIEAHVKGEDTDAVYADMPFLYSHLDHLLDVIERKQKIRA